jgi:hypothetical protein
MSEVPPCVPHRQRSTGGSHQRQSEPAFRATSAQGPHRRSWVFCSQGPHRLTCFFLLVQNSIPIQGSPQGPRHCSTVGSWGVVFSSERGTRVGRSPGCVAFRRGTSSIRRRTVSEDSTDVGAIGLALEPMNRYRGYSKLRTRTAPRKVLCS